MNGQHTFGRDFWLALLAIAGCICICICICIRVRSMSSLSSLAECGGGRGACRCSGACQRAVASFHRAVARDNENERERWRSRSRWRCACQAGRYTVSTYRVLLLVVHQRDRGLRAAAAAPRLRRTIVDPALLVVLAVLGWGVGGRRDVHGQAPLLLDSVLHGLAPVGGELIRTYVRRSQLWGPAHEVWRGCAPGAFPCSRSAARAAGAPERGATQAQRTSRARDGGRACASPCCGGIGVPYRDGDVVSGGGVLNRGCRVRVRVCRQGKVVGEPAEVESQRAGAGRARSSGRRWTQLSPAFKPRWSRDGVC